MEDSSSSSSSSSEDISSLESKFSEMLSQFKANAGFAVDTGEHAVSTMIEFLGHPSVGVSIVVLLSYIRYCINHGLKKDITVKIGHNKPPSIPMNFAVNEELLEDIYPGDVVEIN